MGNIKVTLHNVPIVDKIKLDNEELVVVKGSVP
jgi:ribosomal protein L3